MPTGDPTCPICGTYYCISMTTTARCPREPPHPIGYTRHNILARDLATTRALLLEAAEVLRAYGRDNPRWVNGDGEQDPSGVHDLLRRIEAAARVDAAREEP